MPIGEPAEAGPSFLRKEQNMVKPEEKEEEMIEIPSTGIEFFEYRRRLFLAGLPLPINTKNIIPSYYIIPKILPDPLPIPTNRIQNTSNAIKRIENILSEEGSEELQSNWQAGIDKVATQLHAGKRLSNGLRLGLVIKILKASWIQDGLWPKDEYGRPIKPPDSPIIKGVDLFPGNDNVMM
ncbi:uncharacterized protein I206_103970 [Kwoniella pini CBS 10737]|uniref:Uncharacterized protein n=1 Tax=Kwoniella pini CBS 10737 TaxID=1296096 RepID=A0A1B9I348_9TREE|nr:uncharacterized protein I206_04456 [Kwoniella pini CBS 10737]OCF49925.1 hypothetical protein I206_04456 [Kwoniella pini CBS 10737]